MSSIDAPNFIARRNRAPSFEIARNLPPMTLSDAKIRITVLLTQIDIDYEQGRFSGLEDREQELEMLLEWVEGYQLEMEAESLNEDDSWPDPQTELAVMKSRWERGNIYGYNSFADYARAAFAAEGPHQLCTDIPDEDVEAAAAQVLSDHQKKCSLVSP